MMRVLIADDEPQMRAVLSDLISSEEDLEVVGVASDAQEAADLARELQPDVALVDVKMPEGGGPRAARDIRRLSPGTRIIALSAYNDRGAVLQMLRAGAAGYLVKDASIDSIVHSIRHTSDSEAFLSAQVTTSVIDELVGRVDLEATEVEREKVVTARIRQVLEDPDALTIYFQPIVELGSRHVAGMEALARFLLEPARTPDKWFADAERVGLGDELEIAAMNAAFAVLPLFPNSTYMSVNVSPRVARSQTFLDTMELVRADRIVIEMTEHAPVQDYEAIAGSLQRLRARGVRLAIDDTGAGFASLRHILTLDPDIIKLDISLTRDIDKVPAKRALAAALSTFAREIGCTIVAEGIETEKELDVLIHLGFTHGQGYYLGRPAPFPS
jgi:EAL domain-containing protein (putative c-di-GMP-specific phosphodiesterase class I)